MKNMQKILIPVSVSFFILFSAEAQIPKMPISTDGEVYQNSLAYQWMEKSVQESRILDNMEDISTWTHEGNGELALTSEHSKDGAHSLRLTSPTIASSIGPVLGIGVSSVHTIGFPFGEAKAIRKFNNEDWTKYNRLSFWVYPELPGFRTIVMSVILHNDGVVKVPGPYGGRNGRHFILLKPNQWNHCVWEIAHLDRDKITGVELEYRLQGNEPGATNTVIYDFDKLELQKVQPDYFEGWQVAPGQIAYCQAGYQPEEEKTGIASDLKSKEFSVISKETGKTVLTKAVREEDHPEGRFQVMDFSELTKPGVYFIQAGDRQTQPFEIREDNLRETIIKTINFLYSERCGTDIPGIHDYCHGDWICQHVPTGPEFERAYQRDRQIMVNGGWHDAGNFAQGTAHNTGKATYALFKLSERLKDSDTALYNRLIEEANWGLDWVLKTRFGDGYRVRWAPMDSWTDNIVGTDDDIKFTAQNEPIDNFIAGLAEGYGAQALKSIDSLRSRYSLQCAEEDWQFGVTELQKRRSANIDPDKDLVNDAAALLCSVELFKFTGKKIYSDKAFEYARSVMGCQQTENPSWDIPLTGFFYTNNKKNQIYHDTHCSDEYLLMPGLTELCTLFPDHPDWMEWYSAIALYSNYYNTIIKFTQPYSMIPSSVYHLGEAESSYNKAAHSFNKESFNRQILKGIRLSDDFYLRRFPVWFTFRGNTGTTLSQAISLYSGAMLRNDSSLENICRKQMEWTLGFNPFCESLMYGEGYNYTPMYSALCGEMVGALPVGIQTNYDSDVPYWPAEVCFNSKEVWVHPAALWLLLMSERYDMNRKEKAGKTAKNHLSVTPVSKGSVMIRCTANGKGIEDFTLQGWNIKIDKAKVNVNHKSGGQNTIEWKATITDPGKPCVAVLIPADDRSGIKDIVFNTGSKK